MLHTKIIMTPLGPMLAKANKSHLYYLHFCDREQVATGANPILDSIETELAAYFAGTLSKFTTPIYLEGTHFQQATWSTLLQIPYGQTCSYAQLAQSIGKPTACRAVANANGANPLAIIVPCHRVIYSDGSLGGYAGGVDKKKYLLNIEMTYAISGGECSCTPQSLRLAK